jgi:hypothetical protein
MTQNSSVEINLKQALYDIGDYIEFTITALTGTFSLQDEDDYEICSGSTKINIEKITNSTCTVKTYHNTTLTHTENNYLLSDLLWIIYSTGCTVNFNTKKYYHTVSLIDRIYPVGSIYMSVNEINPSLFIGGTWEQIKDRFLLGAGDTYANESTGGSATVTLTSAQSGVPAHSHKYQDYNTTYTLKTTNRKPGTSTAVAYGTSLTAGGGATERTSSNNTATNASQSHENMPPYLAVYMWKRIA